MNLRMLTMIIISIAQKFLYKINNVICRFILNKKKKKNNNNHKNKFNDVILTQL